MWLGRGDYQETEWELATKDAAASMIDITDPAGYLLAHPMVADYLLEGLLQHGIRCDE